VAEWIAGIDLNNAGFAIVGLFVLAWIVAVAYWRLAKVDERWTPAPTEESA
jgi:high-affinity nickel-transport protein